MLISLDSLSYPFSFDADLSISKANIKEISYTPLYTKGFFLEMRNNYTNPLTDPVLFVLDENRPINSGEEEE
ncbi:hypothetical protein H8356DRAFT_1324406 [Neocallimastix lanati (nom. inval.)]|nr:hypothetical protein H8356DRAFT_1324406 [Neocallimastix sp. JGI-2020a]